MENNTLKGNDLSDLSNNPIDLKENMSNYEENDHPKKMESDIIPFWSENPNVLFQSEYILEFFPVESMSYEQKLNAITRTVILLTIVGFAFSQSFRLLIVSSITLFAIFLLHHYHEKENKKRTLDKKKENFENPAIAFLEQKNIPISPEIFDTPSSSNPFSNVLMTDYDYNPNKKPAPPSFNGNINKEILASAKKLVQEANPDQPDIANKLFSSLGDQFVFEQSLIPFASNPASTIPNDQGAFAEFCYGSMISCKEGNNFACARNLSHYTNY